MRARPLPVAVCGTLAAAIFASAALAQLPHDAPRAPSPAASTADSTRASAGPADQYAEGHVMRAGGGQHDPVANAWVVLHRLGQDHAGPLDSMRTGADGTYRFRYRRTGAEDALYFASTTYGGIAYFAPPFHGAHVTGDDAEITVFDTSSAAVPMRVEGRHFVVSAAHDGSREVLEVYELANDTSVTIVSAGQRPIWTAPVPEGATAFAPGEGESARGAVELRDGRAALFAPVAPGLKQVSFRYQLPASRFPLTVALEAPVSVFEILVEEAAAKVTGPKLKETEAGEQDGRRFRRYLGQDLEKGAAFVIDPGNTGPSRKVVIGIGVALAALLLVGSLLVGSRRSAEAGDAA